MHKILFGFTLFALLLSGTVTAQEKDPLSEKERQQFDQYFFAAERAKSVGKITAADSLFHRAHRIDPSNATVNYEMAQIAVADKRLKDALEYGEQALENDPENTYILRFLGGLYNITGKIDKEAGIYRRLRKIHPDNPDYPFALAQLAKKKGDYRRSLSILDSLEQEYGISEAVIREKQDVYLKDDEVEKAADEIKRLIETFPEQIEYYGWLGTLYSANGYYGQAISAYRDLLKIQPGEPRAHLNLAEIFRSQGMVDSSITHLEKAVASPDLDIDSKVQVLVSLFQASGRDRNLLDPAYRMLETMSEVHPEDPKVPAILGDFQLRDGKKEEARNTFRSATRMPGGDKLEIWNQILLLDADLVWNDSLVSDAREAQLSYPNQPFPYLMEGVAHIQLSDWNAAVTALESGQIYAIDQPEMEEQFYLYLAEAYYRKKEFKRSDNNFDEALRINPKNPTTLNNYAYYLSERGERLKKALEMTELSNDLRPGNPTFLDTWGWVLFKLKEYDEARKVLQQALDAGGKDSGEILEHMGDTLFMMGQVEQAADYWNQARKAGGASEDIDRKISERKLL
ncbi:MAG: tetratricopeptide repeat protein [Bacteroidota bacterium]|nr:tetratricopeptide repeat protein [Bacteroidota bacterium]MDX5447334.1 tetratricopeptide repeat protein [Bacteroidota bacterium]